MNPPNRGELPSARFKTLRERVINWCVVAAGISVADTVMATLSRHETLSVGGAISFLGSSAVGMAAMVPDYYQAHKPEDEYTPQSTKDTDDCGLQILEASLQDLGIQVPNTVPDDIMDLPKLTL